MSTNTINTTEDLIEGVLNFGPEVLNNCVYDSNSVDVSQYFENLTEKFLNYPKPVTEIDISKWFIPNDYYPNLTEYLYGCCTTQEQTNRVSLELTLFIKHGMYDVLHVMKYIVDTLRENNIVWGVGRGSSVASYILYLIGVHKIDSVKYNLPIGEFFKGE
jgi:DNA polymerase III alpha subunit